MLLPVEILGEKGETEFLLGAVRSPSLRLFSEAGCWAFCSVCCFRQQLLPGPLLQMSGNNAVLHMDLSAVTCQAVQADGVQSTVGRERRKGRRVKCDRGEDVYQDFHTIRKKFPWITASPSST